MKREIIEFKGFKMEKIETFEEFLKLADRTVNRDLPTNERVFNGRLGLMAETGEFCDIIKKYLHQGHNIDELKLKLEAFDACWYLAEIINYYNDNIKKHMIERVEDLHYFCNCNWKTEATIQDLLDVLDDSRYNVSTFVRSEDINYLRFETYTYELLCSIGAIFEKLEINLDLKEVLTLGILKLKERFPDKFSVEDSVNRIENLK